MNARLISPNASPARQQTMKGVVATAAYQTRATRTIREPADPLPLYLTPRQLEVLFLLCKGLPNKLISRELDISAATVKVHVGCILRELGVSSRLQAVVAAGRLRLVNEATSDSSMEIAQLSRAREAGGVSTLSAGLRGTQLMHVNASS